jgi:hypothetical protein
MRDSPRRPGGLAGKFHGCYSSFVRELPFVLRKTDVVIALRNLSLIPHLPGRFQSWATDHDHDDSRLGCLIYFEANKIVAYSACQGCGTGVVMIETSRAGKDQYTGSN